MLLNVLFIALGGAVIILVLSDVFQSVVMPRATGRRFRMSFYVWRVVWYLWPRFAWRILPADTDRREEFLAVFAPLMLVALMGIWIGLLIFGFGLILWGLRAGVSPAHASLGTMMYFAGTSLLTIGFGDIVAHHALPRLVSIFAGLAGLSFLSIVTAFLFALFTSFQRRETFVVTTAARAGSPPSGINLLALAAYSQTQGDFSGLMIDAQRWGASVMESHLAYPMLAYFRSSHDEQSWVGTLGTLLDAATLVLTTIDGSKCGQAEIFYSVGVHATTDLSRYFSVEVPDEGVEIERYEFDSACARLAGAGYALRPLDEAWLHFSALRAKYASRLNSMARFFQIPPLQWIGDRSAINVAVHGELKIHAPGPPDAKTS
jgi:hypothetical protein